MSCPPIDSALSRSSFRDSTSTSRRSISSSRPASLDTAATTHHHVNPGCLPKASRGHGAANGAARRTGAQPRHSPTRGHGRPLRPSYPPRRSEKARRDAQRPGRHARAIENGTRGSSGAKRPAALDFWDLRGAEPAAAARAVWHRTKATTRGARQAVRLGTDTVPASATSKRSRPPAAVRRAQSASAQRPSPLLGSESIDPTRENWTCTGLTPGLGPLSSRLGPGPGCGCLARRPPLDLADCVSRAWRPGDVTPALSRMLPTRPGRSGWR